MTTLFGLGYTVTESAPDADHGNVAYITMAGGGAGPALHELLTGRAPATYVKIENRVDYMTTKMIDNTHMIATFGQDLVHIQITGLDFFNLVCSNLGDSGDGGGIQEFYNKYNLHDAPTARVDISISYGGPATVYRAVLLEMTRDNSADEVTPGSNLMCGAYRLELYGVKLNDKAGKSGSTQETGETPQTMEPLIPMDSMTGFGPYVEDPGDQDRFEYDVPAPVRDELSQPGDQELADRGFI